MKKYCYECPKCGSEHTEIYDSYQDIESLEQEFNCLKCGHTWTEFSEIRYRGYSDDTGEYDQNGVEIS